MLGGEGEYSKEKDAMNAPGSFEPMLFEVSNSSGYMNMKQIPCFSQQSMVSQDVYILDNWNSLYIWEGSKSNKFEVKGAYTRADKYTAALKDGRDAKMINIS